MTEMAETHVELNQFPVPRVGPRHSTLFPLVSAAFLANKDVYICAALVVFVTLTGVYSVLEVFSLLNDTLIITRSIIIIIIINKILPKFVWL